VALGSGRPAKAKACKFIKDNMNKYRNLGAYDNIPRLHRYGYYHLGKAIHTIMDSTSPVHQGYQEWHITDSKNHGSFSTSKENMISPADMNRTVDLINRALAGYDCGCAN
jgi:hypothetical protein